MTDDAVSHVTVDWPVGPYYTTWVSAEGVAAWVRYKVRSAEWYVETLEAVSERVPVLDRYVGVEMALDGALAALCGAFDAALGGLIQAAESGHGLTPSPAYRYSWKLCRGLLDQSRAAGERIGALIDAIDAAHAGHVDSQPTGWLAILQRLRNTAVHNNTLARHHQVSIGGSNPGSNCDLIVPGVDGGLSPVPYLRGACRRVGQLCEDMISAGDLLTPSITLGGAKEERDRHSRAAVDEASASESAFVITEANKTP